MLLFVIGMVAACIMDWKEQKVYRFWWLVSGLGAGILLGVRVKTWGVPTDVWVELFFFVVLQQLWFGRFYGRADCHAFCVSALLMTALGMELLDYVMHMVLAFTGLLLVQLLRKNVDKGGQLKKPVPFIPYIAVSLWLWVDFGGKKWYI